MSAVGQSSYPLLVDTIMSGHIMTSLDQVHNCLLWYNTGLLHLINDQLKFLNFCTRLHALYQVVLIYKGLLG